MVPTLLTVTTWADNCVGQGSGDSTAADGVGYPVSTVLVSTPERKTEPGVSPVSLPSLVVSTPLTKVHAIPVGSL